MEVGPTWNTKIRAYGPGLEGGVVNQPAVFTVETNGEVGALGMFKQLLLPHFISSSAFVHDSLLSFEFLLLVGVFLELPFIMTKIIFYFNLNYKVYRIY